MAKSDQNLGPIWVPDGQFTPVEVAMVAMLFDEVTDADEKEIQELLLREKAVRKYCWTKILEYPLSWLLSRVLLGKLGAAERKAQHEVFKTYIKGMPVRKNGVIRSKRKLSIAEFNEKMMDVHVRYQKIKEGK